MTLKGSYTGPVRSTSLDQDDPVDSGDDPAYPVENAHLLLGMMLTEIEYDLHPRHGLHDFVSSALCCGRGKLEYP